MKKIKLLTYLVVCLLITSCKDNNKKKSIEDIRDPSISKIEVIGFHSTNRCITCNAIEANTKYSLNTYFAKELKEGTITLQSINVDEKENEKTAKKFEATGTSLFLNIIKNGKQKQIDLTNFAFSKGRNKEKFSEELKNKITTELKTM